MAAKEGVKECGNHQPVVLNEVLHFAVDQPKIHGRRVPRPNRSKRKNAMSREERTHLRRVRRELLAEMYSIAKESAECSTVDSVA